MASARPTADADVVGASTRSAARSAATARVVTSPGSPGPIPTPTSAGPGRLRATTGSSRTPSPADADATGSDATSRSTASRTSCASDRPVRRATSASRAFSPSGR